MSGELVDLQKDITQFKMEKQMLKKEKERLEREKIDFTQEKEQLLLDRSGKSLHLSPSSSPPHISMQHDYTIKTQKQQAVPLQDKIDLHEYQLRIKRLEAVLRE